VDDVARLNIDADIANADWPKRTPDREADLVDTDLEARAAALHEHRARKVAVWDESLHPRVPSGPGAGEFTSAGGGYQSSEALSHVRIVAMAKYRAAVPPTADEKAWMRVLYSRVGAFRAHSMVRGNARDRAASKRKLLSEFGDGQHAPCVYCGATLDFNTITRDRMYPGAEGGRYRYDNLVPACQPCNAMRSDLPFDAAMRAVASVRKSAHGLIGQVVDADEWVGPDIDHPARHVVGELEVRHVEALGYDRFSVNGLGVMPESVKPHEPENGGGPHAG
jgi:hypothetical protein